MRIVRYFKVTDEGETRTVYRFEETDTGVWAEIYDYRNNKWKDYPDLMKKIIFRDDDDFYEISEAEARDFVEKVEKGTFTHPHDVKK